MKTFKSIQTALVILAIVILAGCSDQVTSSGDNFQKTYNKRNAPEVDKQIAVPVYHTQIRLKPFESYTFNYINTGLIKFNSISVQNLPEKSSAGLAKDPCRNIRIYNTLESDKKGYKEYSCQSSKLDLKEITVENIGSTSLVLDVVLYGEKATSFPPVDR